MDYAIQSFAVIWFVWAAAAQFFYWLKKRKLAQFPPEIARFAEVNGEVCSGQFGNLLFPHRAWQFGRPAIQLADTNVEESPRTTVSARNFF